MTETSATGRARVLQISWKQLGFSFLICLSVCGVGRGLDSEKQGLFLDVLSGTPELHTSSSVNGPTVLDPKLVAEINKLVPKTVIYQSLREGHMEAVRKCIDLLTDTDDVGAILRRALILRGQINRQVWINGVIGTTLYVPGMSDLTRPALVELTPDRFITYPVIEQARRRASQSPQPQSQCLLLDGSNGEVNGLENVLWYFREDIMVNAQHWYWHLIHPFEGSYVRQDRRGELFYYFHQSMLARYNAERLSNNLPLVIPLQVDSLRDRIIEEGYYPYLTDINSKRNWASRQPRNPIDYNTIVSGRLTIAQTLETLYSAIDSGTMIKRNGQPVNLNNTLGIDNLGDLVESVDHVENRDRYGNLHNDGHVLIACRGNASKACPKGDYSGVMVDVTTAMRDISFYRWHIAVNSIFERHKSYLPEYSLNSAENEIPLLWAGVQVTNIVVRSGSSMPKNNLHTFWEYKTFDISRGLDLRRNDTTPTPVPVCIKHLSHQAFEFNIAVVSFVAKHGSSSTKASVRIFLSPRYNIRGQRFTMEEQRKLFFVLDTFTVYLTRGNNVIRRKSTATSLTKPWSKTFAELENEIGQNQPSKPQCGCGWPHHLLLPRGNTDGMVYDLFVLVSNGNEDSFGELGTQSGDSTCSQPYHYCGIRGQPYPDRRPMGYPFDRLPPTLLNVSPKRRVKNLEEYVSAIPNSGTVQVTITHTNQVKTP